MSLHFYDTSALLCSDNFQDKDAIYISNITLKELENIKTSKVKDETTKYRARKISNYIANHGDKISVVFYDITWSDTIKEYHYLEDNDDSKIILCANYLQTIAKTKQENVIVHTKDISFKNLAQATCKLHVEIEKEVVDTYVGFKEVQFANDDSLANFYQSLDINTYGLLTNEYLIVKDKDNYPIDKYYWDGSKLVQVTYNNFKTQTLGNIKPKDVYQELAFHACKNFKTILLRGKAGSGKSIIALSCLFSLLEKNKIDKIIIFTNTVATLGSAKLGYYPGSKDEKLLDSQIGNFLTSKLGDKFAVEDLINREKLILLPFSDIRGYDTTGMNAGIYITEAQNLSASLMQLALQRSDDDSIFIIDGDDTTQVDMREFEGENNGIKRMSSVFRGDSDYAEITLQTIFRSHRANIAQLMSD